MAASIPKSPARNTGPRKRARTSFTGMPPHNSLNDGTMIASSGSLA